MLTFFSRAVLPLPPSPSAVSRDERVFLGPKARESHAQS
ncbi:unnamed protein product [Diplocarpon coronariae]